VADRNFMNARDKFAVAALIGKHIVRHGESWKYKEGWSDEAIAKKFGNGASVQNVKAVRMAAYGHLTRCHPQNPLNKKSNIEARLNKLEGMIDRIYRELGMV